MIKLIKGDLFNTNTNLICHGVNCSGGYGSGVAGQIARYYPSAKKYYLDKFKSEGWKLGDIQEVPQWDGKIIVNCATQDKYLPRGICHADYCAIETCMIKVKELANKNNYTISMPMIGAGLAGGSWDHIEKNIKKSI